MVHEANVKQAAAEKQLKEAQGKVGDDPTVWPSVRAQLHWLASAWLCLHWLNYNEIVGGINVVKWDNDITSNFFICLDTLLPFWLSICCEVCEWTFTMQIATVAVVTLAELRRPEVSVLGVASSGSTCCNFCL